MVNPYWIIEHCFGDDTHRLVHSLKQKGIPHTVLSGNPTYQDNWQSMHPNNDYPVVVNGSIQFCGIVQRKCPNWYPGPYSTFGAYDCTKYYPIFGDKLLNGDYLMMPYGDLNRNKNELFKQFGIDNTIFIRPNRGNKIFTGQTVYKESWDKDIKLIGFYDVPQDELCVISSPKNVLDEWRFFVYNEEVITGSCYKRGGKLTNTALAVSNRDKGFDFTAKAVADQNVTKGFRPDSVWSIDICRTSTNTFYVLEVGCFSCAGIYEADTDKLVDAVNKAAIKDWLEIKG